MPEPYFTYRDTHSSTRPSLYKVNLGRFASQLHIGNNSLLSPKVRLSLSDKLIAEMERRDWMQSIVQRTRVGSSSPARFYHLDQPGGLNSGATIKEGTIGSIFRALRKLPAIQQLENRAVEGAKSEWKRFDAGTKSIIISSGVIILGTTLAVALSQPDSRRFLLSKEIDIPEIGLKRVELKFRIDLTRLARPSGGVGAYFNIKYNFDL